MTDLIINKELSGIVLNQNQSPGNHDFKILDNDWYYQEFFLPSNFIRGADIDEMNIPALSGIQILTYIEEEYAHCAAVDYKVEVQLFGYGWNELTSGTAIGAHSTGVIWLDLYFDESLDIPLDLLSNRFRFAIKGRDGIGHPSKISIPYQNKTVIIDGIGYDVDLELNPRAIITHIGRPAIVQMDRDTGEVTYSIQQGVTRWWLSVPNPLTSGVKAYESDGTTPLLTDTSKFMLLLDADPGQSEFSFCFRLLALVGDEGIDYLGNQYRSVVLSKGPNQTSTTNSDENAYWLSKPNPSRFAVESLYFDNRDSDGNPQTIDRVLLDPITPGVFFHIYYSNEGDPGNIVEDWDNKLWETIPQTFRAQKRESHALGIPVTAKYIKVEFSHLQAQVYSPGENQKPIKYKKHPKWVLDYFLFITEEYRDQITQFIGSSVTVTFDAIDLAYNYYLDDLRQEPNTPVNADPSYLGSLKGFVNDRSSASDIIDDETLNKLRLAFFPYKNTPVSHSNNSLLGSVVRSLDLDNFDYPVEQIQARLKENYDDVSSLNREGVIFDQSFPVMFFYLNCRHKYREVSATFSHDRAYFAGVREIAFTRESYIKEHDHSLYVETLGDTANIWTTDFVTDEKGLIAN